MSEWIEAQLGEIAATRRGISYTGTTLRMRADDGFPYLNMKSFLKDGGYNDQGLKYFAGNYAEQDLAYEGDVLIANTDVTPDGDIVGVPACLPEILSATGVLFSHHVTRLRPIPAIAPQFLYFALCTQQQRRAMLRIARGTTVLMLDANALKRVKVSFPAERREQERIASVLTCIDTAIEKTVALIAKLQQIKAGLMHDLFTRGVLPNGQLRPPRSEAPELYQETGIGWIPKDWRLAKLEDACKTIVDCPHSTPNFLPSGVFVARTMHIKNGVFLDSEASRVSEDEYLERISRAEPLPGDVVFTREAPVGEAFVIPVGMKVCLGQRVMLIKPNPAMLDSDYLVAQIYAGAISTRITELCAGTTNPHLNVADLRVLVLALPTTKEQMDMKSRINAMNARLQTLEATVLKLQKQKLGLMQDLLTGKVAVSVQPEQTGAAA